MAKNSCANKFATIVGIILGILLVVAAFCASTCWVLFLIFMILRLCNVIAWSWWIVCTPLIVWVAGCIYWAVVRNWVGD